MERTMGNGLGASATTLHRAPAKPRSRTVRVDRVSDRRITDEGFSTFEDALLADLAPRGPIEDILVGGIIAAAWGIRTSCGDPQATGRHAARAERSLHRGLQTLLRLRADRPSRIEPPAPIISDEDVSIPDSVLWRERLTFDPTVSENSPVVRGTWITVGQVITRIVDGWSWADILRAHPELREDDIRACLAFTVEDEGAR